MKNRTTILTADSRQPTAAPLSLFVRIKNVLRKSKIVYYPLYLLLQASRYVRLEAYKLFTKFDADGLNRTEKRDMRIIVSLTSYPARIKLVPYTIVSMLNQTVKPDKIILWLGEDQFPDRKLPKVFDKLRACGVDIEFREDIGPHTKYFYAMQEYPEDIIITVDDDWVYDSNIVEKLYKSYMINPECVSAIRFHKIKFLPNGRPDKHDNWYLEYTNALGTKSQSYFACGVGGVLYPPNSLHKEAFNVEAIRKLCPKADDVWLKIMETMNNTKVAGASNTGTIPGWVLVGSQATGLWHFNCTEGQNDIQREAVLDAYNTYPEVETLTERMQGEADGVE